MKMKMMFFGVLRGRHIKSLSERTDEQISAERRYKSAMKDGMLLILVKLVRSTYKLYGTMH